MNGAKGGRPRKDGSVTPEKRAAMQTEYDAEQVAYQVELQEMTKPRRLAAWEVIARDEFDRQMTAWRARIGEPEPKHRHLDGWTSV